MHEIRTKRWTVTVVVMAAIAMGVSCGAHDPTEGSTEAGAIVLPACQYPQVFGNAAHTGIACPEQVGLRVVAEIVQDPDADEEAEFSGFMQIHASPPLTSGDFIVIPSKSGFVDGFDRSPERYSVQIWRWSPSVMSPNAVLNPVRIVQTDWQPINGVIASFDYVTNGYVQQFGPAIANGSVYIPARFGRVLRASLATNAVQIIRPFIGTPIDTDERTIVNNALSVDGSGNVLYTAVTWPDGPAGTPEERQALRGAQPIASWIVQVRPDDTARVVDFDALALSAGLPGRDTPCEYPFGTGGTPLPTGPESRAPQFGCGKQRPAINSPVAVDPQGRLVVYSYANNAQRASFLTVIDSATMTPISTHDARGRAFHGCGMRVPANPNGNGLQRRCAVLTANGTTNLGVDPFFNGAVGFRGNDIMDNAPAIAPNGVMFIGSYDGGFTFGGDFDARSFGLAFHPGGLVVPQEDFYWEVTPSILQQGAELTILQDRNHWSEFDLRVGRYDVSFNLEQTHTIPLDLEPIAIDFVDAHLTFGPRGDVYSLNGDGHLYKFVPGVEGPVEAVELKNADGSTRSMSTLSNYFARDPAGRIYASFAGTVYVFASSDISADERQAAVRKAIAQRPTTAHLLARSLAAKSQALADVTLPPPPVTEQPK